MTDLILHPSTQKIIDRIKRSRSHAEMLSGDVGVGLLSIAKQIAGKNPTIITSDESGLIKIDAVRNQIYPLAQGKNRQPRFVIIDEADKMTLPAQSAFLKILEEPPEGVRFILTAHSTDQILPTILSRVNLNHIARPDSRATDKYIDSLSLDVEFAQKLKFIAAGRPSLIGRYIKHKADFEADAGAMADARQWLAADDYQRQVIALSYSRDRQSALKFIDSVIEILLFLLQKSPETSMISDLEKFLKARDSLDSNANVRLALSEIVV